MSQRHTADADVEAPTLRLATSTLSTGNPGGAQRMCTLESSSVATC